MGHGDCRIVKLGGSLLALPDIDRRLADWLDAQARLKTGVICGGGREVNELRRTQATAGLSDAAAHDLALGAMRKNLRSLQKWFPGWQMLSVDEFPDAADENVLIDVNNWLGKLSREQAPRDWRLTSDSIAALVANTFDARELVLLKSASPPAKSLGGCAEIGFVDPLFPKLAERRSVRVVNLREAEPVDYFFRPCIT